MLNSCQIKKEPKLEISRYGNAALQLRHEISLGKPQPLVSDQKIQLDNGPRAAQLSNGLDVGPFGIPDLNISAEESILSSQGDLFTDRRSRFAEARRRRRDIIKIKIMRSVKLPRNR